MHKVLTKTVYDTSTGDEVAAFESPREQGVFLLPANTVEEPPPEYDTETQRVVFRDGWIVEDLLTETEDDEPERTAEQFHRDAQIERLGFLRDKLQRTDHKVFADYDLKPGEDVEVIKAKRHEWRSEVRQLIEDGYDQE